MIVSFTYEFGGGNTLVTRALQLCQAVWKDRANLGEDNELPIHKNKG
jgi:hypothetical protein